MKKILLLIFIITQATFAQIDNDPLKGPVYKGCREKMNNTELTKCMAKGITIHMSRNLNLSVVNGVKLPSNRVRIDISFKVNKEGKVIDVGAKAPHPLLEKEAIRVVKRLPKFKKPSIYKGEPVITPSYVLPVTFSLDN